MHPALIFQQQRLKPVTGAVQTTARHRIAVTKVGRDLARYLACSGAKSGMAEMTVKKQNRRAPLQSLANGQIWDLGEANLRVVTVGKVLVYYKLAKPKAVRTPTSISGISTLQKFMRKHKAVLING